MPETSARLPLCSNCSRVGQFLLHAACPHARARFPGPTDSTWPETLLTLQPRKQWTKQLRGQFGKHLAEQPIEQRSELRGEQRGRQLRPQRPERPVGQRVEQRTEQRREQLDPQPGQQPGPQREEQLWPQRPEQRGEQRPEQTGEQLGLPRRDDGGEFDRSHITCGLPLRIDPPLPPRIDPPGRLCSVPPRPRGGTGGKVDFSARSDNSPLSQRPGHGGQTHRPRATPVA